MRPGALDEQPHCIAGRELLGRVGVTSGQRQRRHPVYLLAVDAERLAGGDQEADPGRVQHDVLAEPGRRVDQVLAIVQHEQRVLAG
jgi:hypothetical protein